MAYLTGILTNEIERLGSGGSAVRRFKDSEGEEWDAVVGRSSWGGVYLLFIPVEEGSVRQMALEAQEVREAERMLAGADDGELVRLLGRSRPRDP